MRTYISCARRVGGPDEALVLHTLAATRSATNASAAAAATNVRIADCMHATSATVRTNSNQGRLCTTLLLIITTLGHAAASHSPCSYGQYHRLVARWLSPGPAGGHASMGSHTAFTAHDKVIHTAVSTGISSVSAPAAAAASAIRASEQK